MVACYSVRSYVKVWIQLISFVWGMCVLSSAQATLNQQQALFVKKHLVNPHQKKVLDKIFSGLEGTLQDLFDGKNVKMLKKNLLKILKQAGFKIYAIHEKPLNHSHTDGRAARVVASHKYLPEYFLKIGFDHVRKRKNLSRVLYADFINNAIDDLGLTTIGKIKKKLYHRLGRPDDFFDFNYVVLVPIIPGSKIKTKKKEFSGTMKKETHLLLPNRTYKKEYHALKTLIDYSDQYKKNYKLGDDGKLYIIDTEANERMLPKLMYEILGIKE